MMSMMKRAAENASRPRRIGDTSLERSALSRIAKSTLYTCQVLPLFHMLAKAVGVSFYGNTPMQCRYRTRDELVSDAKERVNLLKQDLISWNRNNKSTTFRHKLEHHFDAIEVRGVRAHFTVSCLN